CVGSDGRAYKQRLKRKDDLRQDRCMQQVFALCNELLARDADGARRRLEETLAPMGAAEERDVVEARALLADGSRR
ncbi:MAG: hypothetical protein AAGF23_20255, partial [Acidobacteriota bacterium]